MRRLGLVALLAACNGSSMSQSGDDTQPMIDAPKAPMIDAAPVCTPLGTCDWLDSYQRHIVGVLAGVEDISPGVKIAHRESVGERNATRQFLDEAFAALNIPSQHQNYTSGSNVGANVIGTLDGPGSLIIIGAHFDGVAAGPAAADNATGVAIVLSLARYLRDVPRTHKIAFALFDQEELGLIGSREYVKTLTAGDIASVHIYDMVSFDGDGDHAVELWSPAPAVEAMYQAKGAVAGMPIQPVTFELSDHQAFVEAALPATGVSEEFVGGDHTPNYHKSTDTYANVQFDHLARVTHLAFAVLDEAVR
ncbi:MAG TPA: M28 family peptidase [Kofleriaceae bacterium]|nr:M28 family peptidase [Kofleriaceae bacterium]